MSNDGILVPLMESYALKLKSGEVQLPPEILTWATTKAGEAIYRQFGPREFKPSLSGSNIGHCPRKTRLKIDGAEEEPKTPRAIMNFLMGDFAEISMLTLVRVVAHYEEHIHIHEELIRAPLSWNGINGRGDIFLTTDGVNYVVEEKSMPTYSFYRFEKEGFDDIWGYKAQENFYARAAEEETGEKWNGLIELAMRKDTGHFAEYIRPRQDDIYIPAALDTTKQVKSPHIPNKPLWATIGACKLKPKCTDCLSDIRCQYCEVKRPCWGEIEVEFVKSKPVYHFKS